MADSVAVVSVATPDHLARARSLFDSVARHLPQARRRLVLVARDTRHCAPSEPFEALPLAATGMPDVEAFARRHRVNEIAFAAKPWAMALALDEGASRVLFLDTDIVAQAPLEPLVRALDRAEIVLTPHRIDALPRTLRDELLVLQAGSFNSGFVALREGAPARAFLDWWKCKLAQACAVDVAHGQNGDQRWLDLVPGLFEGVRIVRDPGWNVGPWNLDERHIERDGEGYRVRSDALGRGGPAKGAGGGVPLLFFHFSGLDAATGGAAARLPGATGGHEEDAALQALRADYLARLEARGRRACAAWTTGFETAQDGLAVRVARALVAPCRLLLHRLTSPDVRRRLRGGA